MIVKLARTGQLVDMLDQHCRQRNLHIGFPANARDVRPLPASDRFFMDWWLKGLVTA